jgi:uncharacterized membrane-anchored protein YjiN (DUF445 family)
MKDRLGSDKSSNSIVEEIKTQIMSTGNCKEANEKMYQTIRSKIVLPIAKRANEQKTKISNSMSLLLL